MQKINSEADLRNAILQLESKQAYEGKLLKEQFHLAYNSMKPINIIKSTLRAAVGSKELKNDILSTSVGLTAGYLSKMLFERRSKNPLKKIVGSAVMFGVTNIVAKHPVAVQTLGRKLWKIFFSKSGDRVNTVNSDKNGKPVSEFE